MISALAWVPKGASKRTPQKLQLTDAEVAMMHEMAKDEEEEEQEMVEAAMAESDDDEATDAKSTAATVGSSAADDLPPEFRMDEYDDEDNDAAIKNFLEGGNDMAEIEDSDEEEGVDDEEVEEEEEDDEGEGETAEDLDINMDSNAVFDDDDENDEEYDKEDDEILPTDAVILVANTEDDFSNLEVQVYDEQSGALYVHHEINLPAFPLSLAWMDCAPVPLDPASGPVDGSFVAVGTFKPGIEIWNLDVLDVLEPSATLGGELNEELRNVAVPKAMRKRKDKKAALKTGSHTDAVIALDWNSSHRNMLASGSADTTVKVWDITTQACLYTMHHHTNKVQSVRWNPVETTVLASAGFDRKIVVLDGRQPDACSKFELSGEVESLTWAPNDATTIVAASEDGVVVAFDVRKNGSAPLFRFTAHSGAVSAVSFSHKIPGMLATAGVDKTVKIWDLKDNAPVCITSKEMNVGELFAMSFYQDSPFMLGVGGSKGVLALWDTSENQGVERRFGSRVLSAPSAGSFNLASTFRSPQQLADDLIREEEAEAAARQGATKSNASKKSKNKGKKK